jgi:Sensors of blue-light using FAD
LTTHALMRLAYTSRSNAAPAQREAQARAIAERASAHNAQHGITGLLALVSGRYLQILEGPANAVEALFARIRADTRHSEVSLLLCAPIDDTLFADWSMGLIDRTEAADVTTARAVAIQQRLADDHEISATDFLRWMFAPSANPPTERSIKRQDSITRIAFASPGGVWNAAVLQHLASDKHVRVGRSQVADARTPESRALLEYADLDIDHVGSVRALSMSRDPATCPLMAPMLEGLSLLVFLLGPSEFDQFTTYFCSWIRLPQIQAAQPRLLLLTSLSAERSQGVMEMIRSHTQLPATAVRVKLSEPDSVWAATCKSLPDVEAAIAAKAARDSAPVKPSPASTPTPASARTPTPTSTPTTAVAVAVAVAVTAPASPSSRKRKPAADKLGPLRVALADSACLEDMLVMEGAIEAAVLWVPTAAVLLFKSHTEAGDEAQMQGHAQFLQAKHKLVQKLLADDQEEEIIVVTRDRLHLFRCLAAHPNAVLAVTLNRSQAQLGAAKLRLQEVQEALALL